MTDIKMPPLPEWAACDETVADMSTADVRDAMNDCARANVAQATAPLQAEIEALRAEVERQKQWLSFWGNFASRQSTLAEQAEARAERLAEALRNLLDDAVRRGVPEDDHSVTEAQVALRDHDQEVGNG